MSGYTKLFSDIVDSSIWREDPGICKVWITLLALSDADGYVRGSDAWLADKAKVELSVCSEALLKFQSPDPISRTTTHDGRRIDKLDDGWLILNYLQFRDRLSNDASAASSRERVRRHRERYKALRNAQSVTSAVPVYASASSSVPEEDKSQREGTRFYEAFDQLIDASLKNERFISVWHSWVQDRKARRKALTIRAAELQLAKLKEYGSAKAIRAIEAAIERGWTGIFDPDQRNEPPRKTSRIT